MKLCTIGREDCSPNWPHGARYIILFIYHIYTYIYAENEYKTLPSGDTAWLATPPLRNITRWQPCILEPRYPKTHKSDNMIWNQIGLCMTPGSSWCRLVHFSIGQKNTSNYKNIVHFPWWVTGPYSVWGHLIIFVRVGETGACFSVFGSCWLLARWMLGGIRLDAILLGCDGFDNTQSGRIGSIGPPRKMVELSKCSCMCLANGQTSRNGTKRGQDNVYYWSKLCGHFGWHGFWLW